ncbi:choice-of-anchor D domain-containing protein [Flavobacteriaceae bacterium S0825]|uniref:choice-of-anchor D domain-containing protein n=1 Tax=Gaetbulibacter sp. S0825 TaxID=2720084 RepID=UPI00142FACA3|nr:choice-of-anchor D domain-containing protein [Gaetbulibacter sp. S0825]MCK0109378.1 choice-of-anchor D domain-containing protein [Flavobacteriaceae bacterium S0825]NIX65012.1 choice-of-anchor D domain-containing protein [Gaetbulibacter sp. S0825]
MKKITFLIRSSILIMGMLFSTNAFTQTCVTPAVTTYPYSQNFESGIGNWTQDTRAISGTIGDNFDWTRDSGGTPSNNTGPATGNGDTWYMFIETSNPRVSGDIANFESPCFDLSTATTANFSFWRHMYGANIGSLHVELSTDNGTTYNTTLWSLSGDQGNSWAQVNIDLTPHVGGTVKIRFRGVRGSNWAGDIAVDNVGLTITTAQPEIDILGNAVSIADGDTTPSLTDDTNFGNVDVAAGTSANTFTIQNTGTASLTLTGTGPTYVAISGAHAADFSVTANPTTPIATSGSTAFTVTFNPSAAGLRTATLTIANDDGDENPYNFDIQGYGTSPIQEINITGNSVDIANNDLTPSLLDDTDFGNVHITGVTNVNTFTIENTGTVNSLNLTGISPYVIVSGTHAADFTVTTIPSTPIPASSNTTFAITFDPSAVGLRSATITIANNDSDEFAYVFNIQGTGINTEAPGGVTSNLGLWLKGTEGLAYTDGQPVSLWSDQGNGANATVNTAGQEPTYKDNATDNINFNPVVDFDNDYSSVALDGDYSFDDTTTEFLEGTSGYYSQDVFVVLIPDTTVNSSFGSMDVFCGDEDFATNETDATGIGLGAYSVRFSGEIICYAHGTTNAGDGYGVAEIGTGNTYSNAGIINARNNSGATQQELFYNANNIETTQNDVPDFANVNNSRYWIGRSEGWEASTDARIAEIISYSSRKNDADLTQERNRIQSYLGIKYGITLGVNGTSQDYVNSDGSVIWDQSENSGYNYDIAGIGRDVSSGLNQKQSSSINNATDGSGPIEGILTIGLSDIYTTNNLNKSSNPTELNDKEYLVWGNNGADLNLAASVINVDMSSGIGGLTTPVTFTGMQRIWKVVENGGDIPSVSVRIPQSAIRNISPPGSYLMFISDTPVFDPTADYRVMTPDGSGNLETNYDFNSTKYITFGYAPQVIVERSIYFDGVVDYVDVEDNLDLNTSAFTISAWIKRDTGTTNASIVSKRDNAFTEGYDLRINATGRLVFTYNGGAVTLTSSVAIPENEWHQVAVIYNSGTATLFIDGVADTSASSLAAPVATSRKFLMAAADGYDPNTTDYFAGNIDEVRVWDTALTPNQLRYIMNQEISNDATLALEYGDVIPTSITNNEISAVPWASLAGYYPMSVYTYTNTNDLSGNNHQGALRNLNTVDFQTAPLPYQSQSNGPWTTDATWLNNAVQTLPNALSIVDGVTPIDWNIVETNHNITIDTYANLGRERSVLGLMVKSGDIQVNGDTSLGTGNGLTVTHYLELDGTIDLEGESQLIQTNLSDLDATSSGTLERDQQGTADLYTYNYWAAPVGVSNATTNNNNYTLPDVLNDGTTPATPLGISWLTSGYDGTSGSPVGIADYWIWKYANQLTDNYPSWQHVRSTGSLQPGEGFTMKGTSNTGGAISTEQNYVFNGKPHNADITLTLSAGNDYLIGNPYASAIDADEFIKDNISTSSHPDGRAGSDIIDGTLYFWEHFASSTHILREYQGGYGAYNLSGSTAAINNDTRINHTGGLTSTKGAPERYIPVGQGFFVTAEDGGTITFKNSQRIFKTEASDPSIFMRANNGKGKQKNSTSSSSNADDDIREKIKLYFDSPKGYHRQLLVTADTNATDSQDMGYDAPLIEDNVEDMYWTFDSNKFVIQGVGDFNDNKALPLGVKIDEEGDAIIRIDELTNIPSNRIIYLHDKELETYHDLVESDYEVFLTVGEHLDRFEIVFSSKEEIIIEDDIPTNFNVHYSNSINSIIIINPNTEEIKSLKMLNILGQTIYTNTNVPNDSYTEYKIDNLQTGTYIINIETSKEIITKKVVVE